MGVLFKNAKIIATENSRLKVLKDAYLGVENDTIDYIGLVRPEKKYERELDMYDKLLMPGLVNAHTHSAMNLVKGIGSDLCLDSWLSKIWPIEDKMRDEDLLSGMEMALLEMLAGGTTSFSDMYMRPIFTHKCIGESGIKANLTRVIFGGNEDDDYLSFPNRLQALELYDKCNGLFEDRLHVDWAIHAVYTVANSIAQKWAQESKKLGGRLHIHLSETVKENEDCLKKYGCSPAQWFERNGLFDIPCYAAHCVHLSDDDINIIKNRGVTVVHCPSSNLKLGSGFAKIPSFIDSGFNVALGTDGSASNNNLDMFEEMHIASIIHNGVCGDATLMNPESVIKMATVNGARAQGRFDTGSLEIGKKADIIALDLDKPHLVPDFDTLALVVYSAQASDVCMTMVDGKILYMDGVYYTIDRDRVFRDFRKSCDYLMK